MVRKVQKTLSMPIDLADRLEDEENQSATTAQALREYFRGREGEGESADD